jgi:hypothetical protein
MKSVNWPKPGYASITCSTISNIPYNLIFTTKFNDSSILITIISCDYLNLSLADEHVGGVIIPTQVIEHNKKANQIEIFKSNYTIDICMHLCMFNDICMHAYALYVNDICMWLYMFNDICQTFWENKSICRTQVLHPIIFCITYWNCAGSEFSPEEKVLKKWTGIYKILKFKRNRWWE